MLKQCGNFTVPGSPLYKVPIDRTRTCFLMAPVWGLFSSSPLPVKRSVIDQSPTCCLDCPGPSLGRRYNTLANTWGQTFTVVPYNPSYLLEKGAAAFNQGASGLCAHHQAPHLSFVPLRTPPFSCKPAPLVHFYPPRVALLQRSTSEEPSPEGFLLERWPSTGTDLQSGHLLCKL